jgi:hypothetical protein
VPAIAKFRDPRLQYDPAGFPQVPQRVNPMVKGEVSLYAPGYAGYHLIL